MFCVYDYVIANDGVNEEIQYMGITGAPANVRRHSEHYSIDLLKMFGNRRAVFIDERYNNLILQYHTSRETPRFEAALEQFNEVPANARLFLMPFLQRQLEGLVTQQALSTGNLSLDSAVAN